MNELELQVGFENVAQLERLGELMRREDDNGQDKLNDLYQKIISLPGRAKIMKDMGETLRVLVGLERQAFGLDGAENDPDAAGASGKSLTDTERPVRLARFINSSPAALAAISALTK